MFAAAPALTSLTLSTNLMNVVLSFGVLSAIGQNLAILPTLTLPMAWYSGEFVDFFLLHIFLATLRFVLGSRTAEAWWPASW